MDDNSSINLLYAIRNAWSKSNDKEAKERAEILSRILDEKSSEKIITEQWENRMRCDPPNDVKLSLQEQLEKDETNKELYQAVIVASDKLSWKNPKQLTESFCDILGGDGKFKSAMVLGTKELGSVLLSDEMYLGLIYLAPGTYYPTHAHDATELYHTLLGTALWGPSKRHLKPVEPDNFVLHPSALPHAFEVPITSAPLMAIYCWTGNLQGNYWFSDERGPTAAMNYSKDINKIVNVEKYYDEMATDYEDVVRNWGYNMPETAVNSLVNHAGLSKNRAFQLLDLGCGDGLCGLTLQKLGYTNGNFIGFDISSQMLAKAADRYCYQILRKVDLLKKLPISDETFDYLICVGTTTYLDPMVLQDWLRVVKSDGFILFTHKTTVWPKWEPMQEKLQKENKWKHIWTSPDLFYLPSCSGAMEDERVRVYIYQKS